KGSEFVVRLPAVEETCGVPAQGGASTASTPRRRVLIVDDNVDSAESHATLLRLSGHDVHVAHDGPAALSLAKEFRPELVLLYIGCPGMSGFEVARELRRQAALGPMLLIAVTGYGQDEDRQRSCAAGIDRHLVKPVAPSDVEDLLRSLNAS